MQAYRACTYAHTRIHPTPADAASLRQLVSWSLVSQLHRSSHALFLSANLRVRVRVGVRVGVMVWVRVRVRVGVGVRVRVMVMGQGYGFSVMG